MMLMAANAKADAERVFADLQELAAKAKDKADSANLLGLKTHGIKSNQEEATATTGEMVDGTGFWSTFTQVVTDVAALGTDAEALRTTVSHVAEAHESVQAGRVPNWFIR